MHSMCFMRIGNLCIIIIDSIIILLLCFLAAVSAKVSYMSLTFPTEWLVVCRDINHRMLLRTFTLDDHVALIFLLNTMMVIVMTVKV